MATIRTAIELQDNFTNILYQVISSVNLGLSAMEDLHQTMSSPVDTASMDAARDSINQATIAVQELDAAMQGVETPTIPTPQPTQWQSYDGLEVFKNTGVERFQQEIASVNSMLHTLHATQEHIAATAAQTDLFPASAVVDMERVGARLQAIQQRMQQIENNPLHMGTASANAELERLCGQLNQAIQEQEGLNRAVENMDVQAANAAYFRLSQTIGNTERYLRDNVDEQGRFNQKINEGATNANHLMRTIRGAVAAYATVQTVGAVLDLSDTMTSTTARLNLMNDELQTTEELQQMIFASAQRSRGAYFDTAAAVSKLGLNAGNAFRSSEEVVAFMEQINKQFVIGGASAQEQSNAMIQLTQAMAAGALRGEELNSVLEQAPGVARAIESYMGIAEGSIKSVAEEGKVTAETVKNAMFAAADETNAKFESMPMTFSQIWTSFKNTALMEFQPVLDRLNEIANSDAFQRLVNHALGGLSTIASVTLVIFNLLVGAASTVADNWSWISPIIYGAAIALGIYTAALLVNNAVQAINTAQKRIAAVHAVVHGAAITEEMIATTGLTAAQLSFNAALYACPLTLIIAGIIAVIVVLYVVIGLVNKFAGTSISATGIIAAAFAVLGAYLINTFIIPAQNGFAIFANFIGNVFNNPIAAVKVAFYDMCLTVIGYISNLAHAIEAVINKIPGVTVDITSGLDNFYAGIAQAQKQVKDESGWVEYVKKMDFIDYSDAASAGYEFGKGIEDKISGMFRFPTMDDMGGFDIGNVLDGIYGNTGDTADGTSAIKDALEITEEDLKYLRDIAEREIINRFTTAEIKIEQHNENHISKDTDLDGIMDAWTADFAERLDISGEGVYI